jgi:ribosome biogenesis GTPase A
VLSTLLPDSSTFQSRSPQRTPPKNLASLNIPSGASTSDDLNKCSNINESDLDDNDSIRAPVHVRQNTPLQKLIKDASLSVLETEARNAQAILAALCQTLVTKAQNLEDAQHWIQRISNLKQYQVDTPTIIGVVGNTGAGKSSVINAILDEERLVPTNCS